MRIQWRLVLGVFIVAAAFVAGWSINGQRIENGQLRAEREARANADHSNQTIIGAYRQELERLRHRPARRVRICPDLPAAPGGTDDPAESGLPAGAGRDIGPLLAECRAYAAQLGALIRAVDTDGR